MNLLNFFREYPDEEHCKAKFKEFRDKMSVVCKNCGSKEHYWLASKEQYQCKQCRFRTTLKSGTVMENSKLPFQYWFIAIHLLTSTKKTFSALEMQRQIGHKFYKPIWEMMHKLRLVMGKRDEQYSLSEVVELDEGFFETVNDQEKDELTGKLPVRKRGRGSQKQSKVLVMSSVVPVEEAKKHKKNSKLRYVKMVVMEDLKAETIEVEVKTSIALQSTIKTDGYRSYSKLKDIVKEHQQFRVPSKQISEVLPWVHTIISNAKRTFLGIHHMISAEYFQNYLNEFCYKINRRYFGEQLFDRLLIASVSNTWSG